MLDSRAHEGACLSLPLCQWPVDDVLSVQGRAEHHIRCDEVLHALYISDASPFPGSEVHIGCFSEDLSDSSCSAAAALRVDP